MTNPFSTKKFKQLQKSWYKKLEMEGFVELEDIRHKDIPLKKWESLVFKKRYTKEEFEEKKKYYELAPTLFEYDSVFDTLEQRIIWKLHCEGKTIKETSEQMKISFSKVYKEIRRFKNLLLNTTNAKK